MVYIHIFVYMYLISPKEALTHSMWALLFWDVFNVFQNYFFVHANIE